MSDFQLISDGACDLSDDTMEKLDVAKVPFYVSLNGQDYFMQDTEITKEDFFSAISKENVFPKTSPPSAQAFYTEFEKVIEKGKDALCICAAESLTSSVKSANAAKDMALEKYPDARIEIMDCDVITIAQALFVQEAVKCRDKGLSMKKTIETLKQIKPFGRIICYVSSTKFLKYGGRIGRIASVATDVLNIKPLIVFKDGIVTSGGIVRSRKNGFIKMVKLLKDYMTKLGDKLENFCICIGITADTDDSKVLTDMINDEFGVKLDMPVISIGPTIGTHTGPGSIGIGIVKKVII